MEINTLFRDEFLLNLQNLMSKKSSLIFTLFCLLTSLICYPLIGVFIITFGTYRILINLILSIKYGNKYGGLLSGRDVIWAVEDQSRNLINGLMIVEEKMGKNVPEKIKERIIKEITIGNLRDSKLTSTLKREFGYLFTLKDTVHPSEYIREFDTENPKDEFFSHEELRNKICQIGNLPMPKNHTVFLEVLIGKKPIIWKRNDKKRSYPCILKIHHSLADGVCILQIIMNCFSDGSILEENHNKNKEEKIVKNEEKSSSELSMKEFTKKLLIYINLLVYGPVSVIIQLWLRPKDFNPLHGPELSGKKEFYWKTEDEEECVDLVRKLKRKIPGASFLDILFTATSASFYEYFQKKWKCLPNYMTAAVPARLNAKEVERLITDKIKISNNFTMGLYNMPVELERERNKYQIERSKGKTIDTNTDTNTNTSTMIPRLRETMRQMDILKNSIDLYANYWAVTILSSLIPSNSSYPLFRYSNSTLLISNLPGPAGLFVYDKFKLKDLIFWVPNRGFIGVGVSCLSYDKRFQLGLVVDKALIREKENLQEILEKVPKYLKMLDREITSSGLKI